MIEEKMSLDGYEEGTWASWAVQQYASANEVGTYTKVGTTIEITATLKIASIGT